MNKFKTSSHPWFKIMISSKVQCDGCSFGNDTPHPDILCDVAIVWYKCPCGVFLFFSNHNQPFFFLPPCELVKRKYPRRSSGNNVEGVWLLRNIWAHTWKWGARDASLPLSSWSCTKRPPTQPCDWQPRDGKTASSKHSTDTSAGTFLFFYLNGVKHLHKWEASQYIDQTKKKKSCLFFSLQISFQWGEKSSINHLNLFCTFWDMFRDINRSGTRPRSPKNPNILNPSPPK